MFDGEGNFLKSTANMVGRGHSEYLRVIDASLDEKDKKLYVHCDAPYQMMVFDFDLNLKEIIHMDYYMGEMVVEGNLIYGICYNAPPAKGFCLVSTAKSRPDTEPDTLLTFQNIVPGRWTFGKSLLSRHDGTYVCFPFDTHIYQFRKGEITETYNMDFGDHGLLAHPLPENITPKMFDRYNNGLHWSIVNMSSSDSLLLFNTNSFELFIMDKEKRLCEGYKEAYNDLSRIHCGRIIPTQGLPEGIVFQCNAHSIEETLQAWAKKNDMPLVLKEISRNFNPEGNPLIMIWTIK